MRKSANAMAHNKLQITIPQPCHEDWALMNPTAFNERHCRRCARNIVDFSHFTDRELHRFLAANNGRICGRFHNRQLNRPILAKPIALARWKVWTAAGAVFLAAASLQAQTNNTQTPSAWVAKEQAKPVAESPVTWEIQGTVTDTEGAPLPFASVAILLEGKTIGGKTTDIDGHYRISTKKQVGLAIRIGYVGYSEGYYNLDELSTESKQVLNFELTAGVQLSTLEVISTVPISYEITMGIVAFTPPEEPPTAPSKRTEDSIPAQANYLQNAHVYPNPFREHLLVDFNAPQQSMLKASLNDANGKVLREWRPQAVEVGSNSLKLSMGRSMLIAGSYFLRLTDAAGHITTRVVIKG